MTTKKHLFRIRCWWWGKAMSLLSLTLTFTLVVMMIQSSSAKPCIKVKNFFALRKRIASAPAGTSLNFCPFTVTKPRRASIYVKKSVGIKCNRARKCAIEGAGTHLRIVGPDAKLTLRGFAFRGATKTAVVIAATSKLQHAFFACSFGRNNCFGRVSKGGAIRMATGTSLKVVGGRFFRNRAKAGAGVFVDSGSSLILTKCEFNYNTARGLGIVQVEADARAEISGGLTSFHRNAVENKALGGAIVAVNVGDAVIKSTVTGKLNSGCSGLSIRSQPRCYPFSKIPFELGVLNLEESGISLSQGLSIELVARSSENVTMTSPQAPRALSTIPFHKLPDGAAVFPLPGGDGSYVYTSNSELSGNGGVYGLVFDSRGRPKDYKMLLEGTNRNCVSWQLLYCFRWLSIYDAVACLSLIMPQKTMHNVFSLYRALSLMQNVNCPFHSPVNDHRFYPRSHYTTEWWKNTGTILCFGAMEENWPIQTCVNPSDRHSLTLGSTVVHLLFLISFFQSEQWGTWVSCEEYPGGQCVQVDPTGVKAPEITAIGGQDGGLFEAFAADYRDESNPYFFVTEDKASFLECTSGFCSVFSNQRS